MNSSTSLADKHSQPIKSGTPALTDAYAGELLKSLPGWLSKEGAISKSFSFKNYYETMAFVNAAAWVSHREDHHPDMLVGYNQCRVSYVTHAIDGLSENDFICAAKLDALFEI